MTTSCRDRLCFLLVDNLDAPLECSWNESESEFFTHQPSLVERLRHFRSHLHAPSLARSLAMPPAWPWSSDGQEEATLW